MELTSTIATASAQARTADTAELIARVALALVFILSGADKLFFHPAANAAYMQAVGLPLAGLLVYPTGLVELAGGVLLAVGYQARLAAAALAFFTVAATLLFHNFWAAPGDQATLQMIMFMKNLAMIGGLLLVIVHGAGRLALKRG